MSKKNRFRNRPQQRHMNPNPSVPKPEDPESHQPEPVIADAPDLKEQPADSAGIQDVYVDDPQAGSAAPGEFEEQSDAAETLAHELEVTQAALEKEKKEYLFLMAEFDNYRKRVIREKADIMRNGAEKAMQGLLPIVDDFERGLSAIKDTSADDAARQGMELIYNKLVKYLEQNGVKAIDSTGQPFDTEQHEAIATIPAPTPEQKGKVLDTTTKGYTINDKVLRHAKVVVGE